MRKSRNISPAVGSARARVGALSRSRPVDDPEFIDAKRALFEAKITSYVEKVLAQAPPLTDEQRVRLAELFRPARPHALDRRTAVAGRIAELDGGAA